MIFIETGITKNTDDIHALTKAFFPGEDVRITECDHGVEDASHPVIKHVNSGYRGKLVYKSDIGAMFDEFDFCSELLFFSKLFFDLCLSFSILPEMDDFLFELLFSI